MATDLGGWRLTMPQVIWENDSKPIRLFDLVGKIAPNHLFFIYFFHFFVFLI